MGEVKKNLNELKRKTALVGASAETKITGKELYKKIVSGEIKLEQLTSEEECLLLDERKNYLCSEANPVHQQSLS